MTGQSATEWELEEQLVRAAWYYYVDELTQDEIAKKLSVSRASAGRMLEKARRAGIVTFTINSDYLPVFEVGRRLIEVHGLRDALVIPSVGDATEKQSVTNQRVARGGAQYLQSQLKPGQTLAMGWGDTVRKTFDLLPTDLMTQVSTVTLTGGVDAYVTALRKVRGVGTDGADDWVIPTPILVSSPEMARALYQEDGVRQVIERARGADHALIGIGALTGFPTLAQFGYAETAELQRFGAAGAVGDVLGLFYDSQGHIVDLPLNDRRIGIGIDELRAIPNVVGVAGGMDKVPAIRGALAGGYLDVLVTSEEVARALLGDATTTDSTEIEEART
ncbi:sugar-binding transcriptional regulator [Georgenia daeguensis]|uniref:Sugar-binding transcriptional regulator n=1 Tax=Georgenia daeguensis TaxID=908355 RepID=A0ABP8EYP1_9MICO